MKRRLYFFILLLLPLLSFGSDDAKALFEKGNMYYSKLQYKEALKTYQQILNDGYQSSSVYFNMGNASYKLDDIPGALLYYEKAHKLSPGDDDINVNIQLANLKTADKIDEVPEFFITRWWHSAILALSINLLAVLSVILVLFGSGLLILYFFSNTVSIKMYSFYAAVMFFFLAVLSVFIANRQLNYFEDHQQAIVFSSSVEVKSGPVDQSNSLFVIHDGTKVNVLGNSNGWVRIKLANGNEGWVKINALKEI